MDASFTFDPSSGVSQAVNQVIFTGASFVANYNVTTIGNTSFNFNGYTGAAKLAKSVGVGASNYALRTFSVGLTTGRITLGLSAANTVNLKEGRYHYDVLVNNGSTVYRIVEGDLMVMAGVTSSI
jgi:hypothetical protein